MTNVRFVCEMIVGVSLFGEVLGREGEVKLVLAFPRISIRSTLSFACLFRMFVGYIGGVLMK